MNDARAQYDQHIDAARLAANRGERTAVAESFRAAVAIARCDPARQRELAAALSRLAKLEQELGNAADAERCLRESLDVGERIVGTDDPSLVTVLNELSRLYIKQSNHASAEPILQRLLRIARRKGEDHPDVATALAGIGVAKRGLGDDAAAEQHFRDALRIREKTLAPSNMAIGVTLEQLSETCAARGNLDEAIALLQRALRTREAALGADHATVQSLRGRIAELEQRMKAASEPAAEPAEDAVPGPNDLVFIYEPERPVRRRPAPPPPPARDRMATPTYSAAVALASLIAAPLRAAAPTPPPAPVESAAPMPAPSAPPAPSRNTAPKGRPSIPTPVADMAIPVAARPSAQPWAKPAAAPTRPAPREVERTPPAEPKRAPIAEARGERRSAPVSRPSGKTASAPKRRTIPYAIAVAVVAALAVAGMKFRAGADVTSEEVVATAESEHAPASEVVSSAATTTKSLPPVAVASVAGVARTDSVRTVAAAPAASSASARSDKRASAVVAADPEPTLAAVPAGFAAVSVPTIATATVDSLVGTVTKVGRETYTDQITTSAGLVPSAANDDARVRPPVLIGRAPMPTFPDELRSVRTEGEVVVRFRVDERGAVDVPSMKVVRSDHPLFTAAVRRTLPRFRFEPARTPAPESRARAEWVDFRVEFTAKN
jgi:TonB family protein